MHKRVLHVLFDSCDHVNIVDKELIKKTLGNIPSISDEFAEKLLGERRVLKGLSVITIARSDLIFDDFSFVVDDNV